MNRIYPRCVIPSMAVGDRITCMIPPDSNKTAIGMVQTQ